MSATLASIATDLETAAGASTSANANEAGYWARIAAAAEALAGASTTANANPQGYRLRTAIALESIAGTSGAEENANETGYKKRIVDALEVQAGAIGTGSLDYRMMIAAQNAEFGESLGPELVTNGDPFVSTGWLFSGSDADPPTISGGTLIFNPAETDSANARRTAAEALTAGDYHVEYTIDSVTTGDFRASVGGALGLIRTVPGEYEETVNSAASNQLLAINGVANFFGPTNAVFSRYSVKRIL